MAYTLSEHGAGSDAGGSAEGGFAVLFLVGGRARRLAGAAKSELVVGEATLLERMLAATEAAGRRVVVGARPEGAAPLPDDVAAALEEPPGSGPARAVAAGLAAVGQEYSRVVILPGDLPFLCPEALTLLIERADADGPESGAVFCDDAGRRQWLCGVWPTAAVRANAERAVPGDAARVVFAGVPTVGVDWDHTGPPPWFDCDTPDDLARARAWADDWACLTGRPPAGGR